MKLAEIEHRIAALEHALSNLQQCPADPCHVHYTAAEAEPKYDVTQETWMRGQCTGDTVVRKSSDGRWMTVARRPHDSQPISNRHWPQRRVLIAHAPEMYRQLDNLEQLIRYTPMTSKLMQAYTGLRQLLETIQTELKENE